VPGKRRNRPCGYRANLSDFPTYQDYLRFCPTTTDGVSHSARTFFFSGLASAAKGPPKKKQSASVPVLLLAKRDDRVDACRANGRHAGCREGYEQQQGGNTREREGIKHLDAVQDRTQHAEKQQR